MNSILSKVAHIWEECLAYKFITQAIICKQSTSVLQAKTQIFHFIRCFTPFYLGKEGSDSGSLTLVDVV